MIVVAVILIVLAVVSKILRKGKAEPEV